MWVRSQGISPRCEAGVPAFQDAKRKVWAILPAGVGHESRNGPGTAQEGDSMNGCAPSVLFLLHYDERRAVATPHCSAHRVQRRGRIGTDFQSMRSVTTAMALRQSPLVEIAQPPTKRASPAIKRRLTAMTPVASRLRHRHSLRYRGALGPTLASTAFPTNRYGPMATRRCTQPRSSSPAP